MGRGAAASFGGAPCESGDAMMGTGGHNIVRLAIDGNVAFQ